MAAGCAGPWAADLAETRVSCSVAQVERAVARLDGTLCRAHPRGGCVSVPSPTAPDAPPSSSILLPSGQPHLSSKAQVTHDVLQDRAPSSSSPQGWGAKGQWGQVTARCKPSWARGKGGDRREWSLRCGQGGGSQNTSAGTLVCRSHHQRNPCEPRGPGNPQTYK